MNFHGSDLINPRRGSAFEQTSELETEPAPPTSGTILYAKALASRRVLAYKDTDGNEWVPQVHLGRNRIAEWIPEAGNATMDRRGIDTTVSGTATARTPATTNLFTSLRRVGYLTSTTAGTSAGVRSQILQVWRGTSAGLCGFFIVYRFGMSSASYTSGVRAFVGLTNSTAVIANGAVTAQTNCVGVGFDAGETVWSFINNDATSGALKTAMSSNFPTNTVSTDLYELTLYCPPNGSFIGVRMERVSSTEPLAYTDSTKPSFITEQKLTTRIPANNLLLAPQVWVNNGSLASAVGIDIISMYLECDT